MHHFTENDQAHCQGRQENVNPQAMHNAKSYGTSSNHDLIGTGSHLPDDHGKSRADFPLSPAGDEPLQYGYPLANTYSDPTALTVEPLCDYGRTSGSTSLFNLSFEPSSSAAMPQNWLPQPHNQQNLLGISPNPVVDWSGSSQFDSSTVLRSHTNSRAPSSVGAWTDLVSPTSPSTTRQRVNEPIEFLASDELQAEFERKRREGKISARWADEDGFGGLMKSLQRCLSFDLKKRNALMRAPNAVELAIHLGRKCTTLEKYDNLQSVCDELTSILMQFGGPQRLVVVTSLDRHRWTAAAYQPADGHASSLWLFRQPVKNGPDRWSPMIPESLAAPITYAYAAHTHQLRNQAPARSPNSLPEVNIGDFLARYAIIAPVVNTSAQASAPTPQYHGDAENSTVVGKRRNKGGPRPYICETCGYDFCYRKDLVRHISTHKRGRRRFQCLYCEKTFTRKDNLTRHNRTAHPDCIVAYSNTYDVARATHHQ